MHSTQRFLIWCSILFLALGQEVIAEDTLHGTPPVTEKVTKILADVSPVLEKELQAKGFRLGAPIFLRIFKLSADLEVWIEANGRYEHFKTYSICDFSGFPGPKLQEGDWQSPEGFYSVSAEQLNPNSSYHLSFNIGYPNEFDRQLGRSGGNIMVHGNCSSMGCFAMNDFRMEEIYTLAHNSLLTGQEAFDVHIFPFRMSAENLKKFQASPWKSFWQNLKEGYDAFENSRQVPDIHVSNKRYIISDMARVAIQQRTSR